MGEYMLPGVRPAVIYSVQTSWGLLQSVWQKVMVVKEIRKVGCSMSLSLLGSSVMLSCPGKLGIGGWFVTSMLSNQSVFVQNLVSGVLL